MSCGSSESFTVAELSHLHQLERNYRITKCNTQYLFLKKLPFYCTVHRAHTADDFVGESGQYATSRHCVMFIRHSFGCASQ